MHTLQTYASAYGTVFVLHAFLAVLSWAVLTPLGHVLSKFSTTPSRAFGNHRVLMLTSALLTAVTYVIGVAFSSRDAPLVHKVAGTALILVVVLQVVGGTLRPPKTDVWREMWAMMHATCGAVVMCLGAWLVHHSLVVFHVPLWVHVVVNSLLVVAAGAVVVAHVVSRNRVVGQREEEGVEEGVDHSEREQFMQSMEQGHQLR